MYRFRFNDCANTYDANAIFQRGLIDWGLPHLEQSLENKTILELGSGTGLFTQAIKNRSPKNLIASDTSQAMLKVLNENLPQVPTQLIDAFDFKLPQTFDRITSANLLQWSPDPLRTLTTWKDHLNIGGKIEILMPIAGSLKELYSLDPTISPIDWKSKKTWQERITQAGFTILKALDAQQIFTMESPQDILRALHRTGTQGKVRYSSTGLRKLLKDYQSRYGTEQGKTPCTWHWAYFLAGSR